MLIAALNQETCWLQQVNIFVSYSMPHGNVYVECHKTFSTDSTKTEVPFEMNSQALSCSLPQGGDGWVVRTRKWWVRCPKFESRWNLAIFQAIVEWPKKPTCCYSTLSSTASALETLGDGMNLHRHHLKNTACITINMALKNSYMASEPCSR